ncbi:MAG: non-canonical purine NTP pyrophosphatase [Tenericutes bacterium]|nr:non-canonical purine NTP pyrophosphatase [Mycoplasmatota bacterium]
MKITYVTGNKFKVYTAEKYLNPLGFTIDSIKLDIPEIQADSIEDISVYSANIASKELNKAVLVNDSGLIIPALGDFPGPYSKYVEKTIKEDGILQLMQNQKNRDAYFLEVLVYKELDKEPKVFKSLTKGSISKNKKGTDGWSYDFIFIPEGSDKTLAEYTEDERYKFFDDEAYIKLADYIKKNQ